MDQFWQLLRINLADWSFVLMAIAGGSAATVHFLCTRMLRWYPDTQPDENLRRSETKMHLWMMAGCLTAVNYMWIYLEPMRALCATDPVQGMVAHVPWVIAMWLMLFSALRHFRHQLMKVRAV